MPKLYEVTENDKVTGYFFDCPGCKMGHEINISPDKKNVPVWSFNGDLEKPTITPSIRTWYELSNGKKYICHIFVTDGKIQYLSDCTHALAGQTIDMNDIEL